VTCPLSQGEGIALYHPHASRHRPFRRKQYAFAAIVGFGAKQHALRGFTAHFGFRQITQDHDRFSQQLFFAVVRHEAGYRLQRAIANINPGNIELVGILMSFYATIFPVRISSLAKSA
jgi:hypothetical protein